MDNQERLAEARRKQALAKISAADNTQPESMPHSDAYLVTYEDGSERTVWGYTIRYVADVSDDDLALGDVVKIERVGGHQANGTAASSSR